MSGSPLDRACVDCGAQLSLWEHRCACRSPLTGSVTGIFYSVACSMTAPIRISDYVRLADAVYGRSIQRPTANVYLAGDHRLCWAGQGLYGLLRHGPLPGPRSLAQVARLVLAASDEGLTLDGLHYCLTQLGYRYNRGSLYGAVTRTTEIRYDNRGFYTHPGDESAWRRLLRDIPVIPPAHLGPATRAAFADRLATQVAAALETRARLVRDLATPVRVSMNWEFEVPGDPGHARA